MKLSPKQIAASAAGAVASALIASLFGEKGTIIGVALGSAVASTSTALVVQSIERTHDVVKQVVKVPKRPSLLRQSGTTEATGTVTSATAESPVTEAAGLSATDAAIAVAGGAEAIERADAAGEVDTPHLNITPPMVKGDTPAPTLATGPATGPAFAARATGKEGERRLIASSRQAGRLPMSRGPGSSTSGALGDGSERSTSGRAGTTYNSSRIRWSVLALTIGVVFVVALVVVTGFELIAGKPISSILGSSPASGGTSVGSIFTPSPTTTPPSTTTPTTAFPTTTTSPTTTTVPGSSSTTTTVPGTTTTTTTSPASPTTTSPTTTSPTNTSPTTSTTLPTTATPSTGSGTRPAG